MATWRWGVAAGALAAAAVLGVSSCGDDDDDGGGAAAPPPLEADTLRLEIESAVVPEFAGTAASPTVRFRVVDGSGAPVNLEAEMATTTAVPRTSGPRFTLAMLQETGDYLSYYEADRAPAAYTFDGTKPTPATRKQASSPALTAQSLRQVSPGVYEYTFPAPNVTTGLDRTKTHTVAGWISEDPRGRGHRRGGRLAQLRPGRWDGAARPGGERRGVQQLPRDAPGARLAPLGRSSASPATRRRRATPRRTAPWTSR